MLIVNSTFNTPKANGQFNIYHSLC